MNISLASKCIENEIHALKNMYSVHKSQPFLNLLYELEKVLDNNGKIIITGVGKNGNIAAKASETFVSLGLPSFYLNTSNYFHGDAGFISDNDYVIALSKSGKTDEIVAMFDHLQKTRPHIKNILIHCNSELPYDTINNLFLGEVIEGDRHELAPTSSTTLLLCFLDCISVVLSDSRNFTEEQFLGFHPSGTLSEIIKDRLI